MKTKLFIWVILFLCFFISACGLLDETQKKCGDEINKDIGFNQYNLFTDSALYQMHYEYNSSAKQTTISFSTPIFEDVCPDEHTTVNVNFQIDKNYPEIIPKAHADWYPATGSDILLSSNNSVSVINYWGSYNIGLKQVYNDKAGRFYISCSFTFPSQIDRRSDIIWLNNLVVSLVIGIQYYLFL